MDDIKRIMLECRYLLSLNKNYYEISRILNVSEKTVYNDINNLLKNYDTILYQRVIKKIRNIS